MRRPWEIDWADPRQVQQQTQRPSRIQGPPREAPPQTAAQATRDAYGAQQAPVDLERARIQRDREAREAQRAASRPDAAHLFEQESNLRSRFDADEATQAYRNIMPMFASALRAGDNPVGDMQIITAWAKAYDPIGSVREGDVAAAEQVQNMIQRARANVDNWVSGTGRLRPEARRQFLEEIRNRGSAWGDQYNRQRLHYRQMAEQYGLDPDRILGPHPGQDVQALEAGFTGRPVRNWDGSQGPGGAAPAIGAQQQPDSQMTQVTAPIYPNHSRDNIQVQGGLEQQESLAPSLAGLNNRINDMMQRRRPLGEILGYLRERGVNVTQPGAQGEAPLHAQLRDLRRWQNQNPGYRGPFEVNVERYMRPTSAAEQIMSNIADSPVGAYAAAGGDVVTGGHLDNLVGLGGGDAEMANLGMQEIRQRHPYASIAGDIGGGAGLYGGTRAAVTGLARQFPRAFGAMAPQAGRVGALAPQALAGDAAMGAYIGSGQEGTDPFSLRSAGIGAAFGAGGGVAGRQTINSLGAAVSPTGGSRSLLYAEGVQPTVGQRVGGVVDRFEQAITSVPGLGGIPRRARNEAIEQFETGAFNQALREVGAQLPQNARFGTRAHDYMQRVFNVAFRRIRSRSNFVRDGDFDNDLSTIRQDVALLDDASQAQFERIVSNELEGRLSRSGGALRGRDYVRVASRLDQVARNMRRNPNSDPALAEAFEELSSAMDRSAIRHGPPELGQMLTSARRGYQRAVVIEDAARRRGGGAGRFSPTQLDAAVQNMGGGLRSRAYLRGDAPMQQYAEQGLHLGDTLANSGTVDRILASGAVGSAGYANPWLLAPMATNIALTAPGIRKGVNALLAPNRSALTGMRSQIEDMSRFGGAAGLPFVPYFGPQ